MGKQPAGLHRQIFRVPHLAAAGTTIQTSDAVLRELSTDYFLLVLVRRGRRTVRRGAAVCTAGPGEGILMAPGVYDVTNSPDGGDEPYRSDWLAWDTDLVIPPEEAEPAEPAPIEGARRLPSVDASFEDAFTTACKALETSDQLPRPIVKHRVLEVLIWLQAQGLRLASPGKKSLGDQIREMVTDDPAADWSVASLAAAFSTSEATLRRRLGAEGISAKQLISDARMWRALALLQSTDLPVSRIALDSGYASASRFAARFRARFDLAPSAVRGHRRDGPAG